jgi:hypothetical protein
VCEICFHAYIYTRLCLGTGGTLQPPRQTRHAEGCEHQSQWWCVHQTSGHRLAHRWRAEQPDCRSHMRGGWACTHGRPRPRLRTPWPGTAGGRGEGHVHTYHRLQAPATVHPWGWGRGGGGEWEGMGCECVWGGGGLAGRLLAGPPPTPTRVGEGHTWTPSRSPFHAAACKGNEPRGALRNRELVRGG